jgi:hypothetical protein
LQLPTALYTARAKDLIEATFNLLPLRLLNISSDFGMARSLAANLEPHDGRYV